MNANLVVKVAAGAVGVLVAGMLAVRCSGGGATATGARAPAVGGEPLAHESAAALGIEADTPDDVVRTLVAQVRTVNERLEKLEEDNGRLRDQNERLRDMRGSVVAEVQRDLKGVVDELTRVTEEQTESARREYTGLLGQLERIATSRARGDTGAAGPLVDLLGEERAEEMVWLEPMDAGEAGGLPWAAPGEGLPFGSARKKQDGKAPLRPVYTVPRNATLVGATAFTALIGRVPIGEEARVTDPYFFKVLIGRDNLAANGHEIPEVEYAVASGEAIGDWNLGCVSGDVQSVTFVFGDGRIVTIPEARDVAKGAGGAARKVKIGALSDDYGNPCVGGERITNAAAYLAQSAGAMTLGAAAEGIAAAETTRTAGAFGAGTVVTGDIGRYAAGRGLAGTAQEVAKWIRDRQAQEYDVVYVAPGATVAMHVTEELRIDYDPAGRLVHHDASGTASFRALD